MSNTEDRGAGEIKVVAYLHPTSDDCVTIDPTAYQEPRKLVLLNDVIDKIEYLETGLGEWRTYAVEAGRQLAAARKEIERLKVAAAKPAGESAVPPGFASFWDAWPTSPRKVNKKACLTRWNKAKLEPMAQQIIDHVQASKIGRDWSKDGGAFIPAPLVYLNQERYLAPPSAPSTQVGSLARMNYKPTGVDNDGHFA